MDKIEAYQNGGRDLYNKLHLATYPIGIKYITHENKIPENAMRPSVLGGKMSLCQAFTQARRWDSTVAMTADDNFCTPSSAFHGWVDVSLENVIDSQVRQGWHSGVEAERMRIGAAMNLIEGVKGKYCGFVCAPLQEIPMVPDSVLIYADGVQLTHLIHAVSYDYLHVPVSHFEGYGESCMKGGFIPFVTGKPQIVIPGAGDRSFAAITENELAIGIPATLLFNTLENLFKSGGVMNIGYPMKSMLPMGLNEKITPGFSFLREKIDEKKDL